MKVSKNRWRGAHIEDLNELVGLAEDKQSVVVAFAEGRINVVRPAAFILNWSLSMILHCKIYHALDYDPETVSHGN